MARGARSGRVPVVALALAALVLGGCTLGPVYSRPQVPTPPQHRFAAGPAEAECIADTPWWELFGDPALAGLIREATLSNLDLRTAAWRVEEARARAGVASSYLLPEVSFGGQYTAEEGSHLTDPPQALRDTTFQNHQAAFQLSWEVDLFGRIRREREAALAQVLATEQGRRGVLVTLVADVAAGYFQLLELDHELAIARRTLALNDQTVAFYTDRLDGGVSNRLEVDQATANRAITAATIPELERQVAVTENALCLLLGRLPGPVERGAALVDQKAYAPAVPAGLPASLLERRPDVLEAEQLLVAANADVGVARALFFPTISLSGLLGGASHDLDDLFDADATVWSLAGGIFQPIFQGGRIRQNYAATQARFEQALAQYQKAALNAYRESADALVTIATLAAARVEQEKGVAALQDAALLSRDRYEAGLSSYLEILIADQSLFLQERLLAQTRGAQLVALVDLYRALGGGWQPEAAESPAAGAATP